MEPLFIAEESVSAPGAPYYRECKYRRREPMGLPLDPYLYADSVWKQNYFTSSYRGWIELNRVHDGTFVAEVEGRTHECPPGGYLLLRDNVPVVRKVRGKELRREMLLFLSEPVTAVIFRTLFPQPVTVFRNGAFADEMFRRIVDAIQNGGQDRKALNSMTWTLLASMSAEVRQSRLPPELRRALEYLERHSPENPTLQEIAKNAQTSLRTLNRMFRRSLQTTPMKHANTFRMQNARNLLLLYPDKSVKEIAVELNFGSSAQFSEAFRKFHGTPPGEYRRMMVKLSVPSATAPDDNSHR